MITYINSVALANKLKTLSPKILGIELFGSVVRKGEGNDADFLILVDKELAKKWWYEEREFIKVRWPDFLYGQLWVVKKFLPFIYNASVHEKRKRRLEFFAQMLNIDLKKLENAKGELPNFEVFLVPEGWHIGPELNTNLMGEVSDLMDHKNTLGFFKRIARDAVTIT